MWAERGSEAEIRHLDLLLRLPSFTLQIEVSSLTMLISGIPKDTRRPFSICVASLSGAFWCSQCAECFVFSLRA